MNTGPLIPLTIAVLVLLVLAALFVLSYSKNIQRRLRMLTSLPVRRMRNILLAAAAMCFLLINPVVHAILLGAGFFLYRFFVKEEEQVVEESIAQSSFFQAELLCTPAVQADETEALGALRKCLFSSFYIVPASESQILTEGEAYKLSVTLFSEKYLNSFIHFLGESGFTTISNTQNKNQGLKGSMFTENAL